MDTPNQHENSWDFLNLPGGGSLAGANTVSGTATTWVPLLDQDGSTIGLVNAANVDSGPATTYTYDPSGTPTVSGSGSTYPFEYQGLEKEPTDPGPYYYSGGGQYYSPQLVRSLSETSQTSSNGPGGPSARQLPYGPGSQGNGSFGHWLANEEEGNLEGGIPDDGGSDSDSSGNVPVLSIIRIIQEWVSFFDWLFGGSSAPPTPRQLFHGRHPLYDWILELLLVWSPRKGLPSTLPRDRARRPQTSHRC